jgi:hypothetical protein
VGAEVKAARIRLRAERRLSDLIKAMSDNGQRRLAHDGRPSKVSRGPTLMLGDLGIDRHRASRAMQLASTGQTI